MTLLLQGKVSVGSCIVTELCKQSWKESSISSSPSPLEDPYLNCCIWGYILVILVIYFGVIVGYLGILEKMETTIV